MATPSLPSLRAEIARTDERILREVARRLELAREVGRQKRVAGLPLRDYPLEVEVARRWIDGLGPSGVAPDRGEALARWMIEEAVYAQESVPGAAQAEGLPADVVVVGGLGQMGAWMRDYLRTAGFHVGVFDPKGAPSPTPFPVYPSLRESVRDADLVVVATPMRVAPSIYRELRELGTEATVFDILSIKAPLLPEIRRSIDAGLHIGSAHPLFGPGARSLSGRNLLVLDCGDAAAAERVSGLFDRSALRVTRLPIEDHDPLMAEVLGLPHVLSLLFARTLQRGDRTPQRLARETSTSFRRIAEVAQLVTQENPELVGDIQTLNPASEELFARLETVLRELHAAVSSGASARYAELLVDGRTFLEAALGASP